MRTGTIQLLIILAVAAVLRAGEPPQAATSTKIDAARADLSVIRGQLAELTGSLRCLKDDLGTDRLARYQEWRADRDRLRREQLALRSEQSRLDRERDFLARADRLAEAARREQQARLLQPPYPDADVRYFTAIYRPRPVYPYDGGYGVSLGPLTSPFDPYCWPFLPRLGCWPRPSRPCLGLSFPTPHFPFRHPR